MSFKFEFAEKDVVAAGQTFRFKELSVADNDFCAEAARQPDGDIDARKMMRLMIVRSSVEPKITLEDLADIPNRFYIKFAEAVNDLNTPDYDEDQTEPGNA